MRPYRFSTADSALRNLINDLLILSGDKVGPSNVAMRDIIGTAMTNAEVLAKQLRAAYDGNVIETLVFPSPNDGQE